MTVRELIRILSGFDENMLVRIGMEQTYGVDFAMDIRNVAEREVESFRGYTYNAVVITEGNQCGSVDYDKV